MAFKLVPIQKIYKSEFCEKNGCACMDENHHCTVIWCPYRVSVSGTAEEMRQYRAAHIKPKLVVAEKEYVAPNPRKRLKNGPVIATDEMGKESTYDNVRAAAEAIGKSDTAIYQALRTGFNMAGRTWRYKDA